MPKDGSVFQCFEGIRRQLLIHGRENIHADHTEQNADNTADAAAQIYRADDLGEIQDQEGCAAQNRTQCSCLGRGALAENADDHRAGHRRHDRSGSTPEHGSKVGGLIKCNGYRDQTNNKGRILQDIHRRLFDLGIVNLNTLGTAGGNNRILIQCTAEDMLAALGVTEESCGCPIISSMETKVIGQTAEGHVVQIDRHAAEADGIIVINRIKPHPVFVAPYESGLMKMMTIGLGKQKQAEVVHQMGFENFHHLIPLFGNAVLDHANILFGLAIIENAYDQTNRLVALTPECIRQEEPSLLLDAKAKMPRLLPGYADILVVDKMGKDISGDGMDPNITGRFCQYYTGKPNFTAKRVAVLDLTEATHGNFIGIEAADVTTRRVIDKADPEQTYPNSLTSCGNQHMPMYMKNDREAIQCAIKISTGIDLNDARIIRIPDTLHVTDIMVSENMLPEILQRNDMQVLGEPEEWPFDENGNLW